MKKSAINESKEANSLDVLSTELSSNLQIDNIVEENAISKVTDEYESDCSPELDVTTKQEYINNTESQNEDHEGATKGLENILDESAHFKSVTGNLGKTQKTKDKKVTRKKMKDYNIISIRNAVAKPPSYFKFDKSTTHLLELLVLNGYVGEYHSVIGKGIKSNVIHADCHGRLHTYFPTGNAVKVYKISKDEEKNKAICKCAQREIDLLYTLSTKHIGNNYPHPVYHTKNIIIMSFIGTDQETAPSITTVPSERSQETYDSIVKEMDLWYNKFHLVHGNLSEKTILCWFDKLYYIGWSHFVLKAHPKALIKLMRDCQFVTKFFEAIDVPVKTTEELFKDITGLDDISSKVLEVIHTKDLWKDQNQTNPNRKSNNTSKLSRNSRFK